MKNKRRIVLAALVVIVLGVATFLALRGDNKEKANSEVKEEKAAITSAPPERLRIVGTGDMLPHETVNQQARSNGEYDYRQFFDQVEKYFQSADVRFCNQEAPSSPSLGVSAYPTFNAPPQFARDLFAVGCNVISLANNHLNDKGQKGIDGTRGLWDEIKPLAVAGANRSPDEQQKVQYFETKGVRFAFVAYSEISNNRSLTPYGLNMLNERLVNSQLTEARRQADIVLVSVHWGSEYDANANSNQEKWAKIFADNGADIVFGTGPHVLQPVKKLAGPNGRETVVFYSLGNFLSTQLDTESLIGGFAIVDINPSSKKIERLAFLPTYMHYEWTAQEKSREDLLARKNLKVYPLDQAAEPLTRSQIKTTVADQTKRVTDLLNKFTQVQVITPKEF